ncbi:MAG TPA: hypothetical protein VF719_11220 [Abditibacteriaceae bacterium]|jgi:hypothetical protein
MVESGLTLNGTQNDGSLLSLLERGLSRCLKVSSISQKLVRWFLDSAHQPSLLALGSHKGNEILQSDVDLIDEHDPWLIMPPATRIA